MDFLKKHYEKILLGIVLLGLVAFAALLPAMIARDHDALEEKHIGIIKRPVKPLPPLDLASESNAIQRVQSPYNLDFETTNRLFNPVQWQRMVNGDLIKLHTGNEVNLVTVTQITPLYLILTLDSVQTNEFGARYIISVERQAAPTPSLRARRQHYSSKGDKNETYTIRDVKGPVDDPTQLVLTLADTGEEAVLSKDKPFRRVDGYMADLKYDPEAKKWFSQRVGAVLKFGNDSYNIVAINQNEVVLSALSNQKKTTLPYNQ
ncbi:MAG TPA: hypothetical protein VHG89_01005 [Verrucomicrobiae bacterium]|nr:hypothetical protein [Verrucomicrobiae bacterium]